MKVYHGRKRHHEKGTLLNGTYPYPNIWKCPPRDQGHNCLANFAKMFCSLFGSGDMSVWWRGTPRVLQYVARPPDRCVAPIRVVQRLAIFLKLGIIFHLFSITQYRRLMSLIGMGKSSRHYLQIRCPLQTGKPFQMQVFKKFSIFGYICLKYRHIRASYIVDGIFPRKLDIDLPCVIFL